MFNGWVLIKMNEWMSPAHKSLRSLQIIITLTESALLIFFAIQS